MAQRNLKSKSTKVSASVSPKESSFLDRIQNDLENRQSILSLILGVLIVIVIGALVFNYLNKPQPDLGPSQQTDSDEAATEDVSKEDLPGKYTVKEGDTLFLIAEKYYDNGFLYPSIVEANKLANADAIEVGQVLEIPEVETKLAAESSPSPSPMATEETLLAQASPTPIASPIEVSEEKAKGGATNQTIWGESINSDTYKVVEGDWLSKIAGRAYGDIYAFDKIAKANNIANPDLIEPGITLKIPR